MKIIATAAISLLAAIASADDNKWNEMYQALAKNMKAERALLQNDMGLFNQYGCWCYFEGDHGSGRGHPVDELDEFCKTLHDGYSCIIMDAADMNMDCGLPWTISYNSAFGSGIPTGLTMDGLKQECDAQNNADTCEAWTCKVEGWFVQQYFLYAASGGIINPNYRHANGYNPKASCPISNGIQSEKACCGEYPIRFPFKTYNGARDCCYSHTFNTNLYQCCSDGHVRMTC